MKNERRLKIGIVGAGDIVRTRHLPNLQQIPGVEIVAVANATFDSAKRVCEQYLPQATPMKFWADLVALPDLDIIWIGTPPHLHCTVTLSALEAGRHVFCQARMATNLAEAMDMLAAARANPHLVTMLCPPPFGMKADLVIRRLLAEQAIGPVHHVRLRSFHSQYLDPNAPPHWRQRAELSGLNVLTLGIYAEVLQRWLGPIRSVFARAKTVHPVRQGYEIRIPDLVTVLCQFENGAEGVLEFSGVAGFAPPDAVEIYGAAGSLFHNFATDEICIGRTGHPALEPVPIPPEMEGRWHVERDFIAAVRSPGSIKPSPTFEEGVAYMRVVQGVADSIREGREILLSELGKTPAETL